MEDYKNYRERFKPPLSRFGQSVLEVMIDDWKTEKESKRKDQAKLSHVPQAKNGKRTLVFHSKERESYAPFQNDNMIILSESPCSNLQLDDFEHKLLPSKGLETASPTVPTSSDLFAASLQTRDTQNTCDDSFCRDDLLNTKLKNDNDTFKLQLKQMHFDDTQQEILTGNVSTSHNQNEHFKQISWNELFDPESLLDVDPLSVSTPVDFEVVDHGANDNLKETIPETNLKRVTVLKDELITPATLDAKHKAHAIIRSKIIDIPKKIKKCPTIKKEHVSALRKEKYTKTVKNWLKTVHDTESEIVSDEEGPSCATNKLLAPVNEDKNVKRKKKSKIEKKKKVIKKAIQSQLANKDGVMKKAIQSQLANKDGVMKKAIQSQLANKDGVMKKAIQSQLANKDGVMKKAIQSQLANKDGVMKKAIQSQLANKDGVIKKAIQSQLANKDGVMKFKIPATVKNKHELAAHESTSSESAEINNDSVQVKRVAPDQTIQKHDYDNRSENKNEAISSTLFGDTKADSESNSAPKRVKPKFVAPIKAQPPVKDIQFHVREIDNDNFEEFVQNIYNYKEEIVVVIVFSAGASQLSQQCGRAADGLALLAGHCCYYVRHQHCPATAFRDLILRAFTINWVFCFDGKSILKYIHTHYQCDLDDDYNMIDVQIACSLLSPWQPVADFQSALRVSCSPQDNVPDASSQDIACSQNNVTCSCPQYNVPAWASLQRVGRQCAQLRDCAKAARDMLRQQDMWQLYNDIEMRVIPIVAGMEVYGVPFCATALAEARETLRAAVVAARARADLAAGRPVNVASAKDVSAALADAGINVSGTAEHVLRAVCERHPLPREVLRCRRVLHAQSTLAALEEKVDDGVVYPTWHQLAAVTGRMSCSAPNLQAVERDDLELHPDEQDFGRVVSLRSCVVSSLGALVAADFRQVECRVLAALSQDLALRRALGAEDLFAALTAHWLQKPVSSVSECERSRTKRLVYAALYGAGPVALRAMAAGGPGALQSFYDRFPSLRVYRARLEAQVSRGEALRTAGGRRAVYAQGGEGRRRALNYVIQGSAADLCKVSMVRCAAAVRGLGVRLTLQLHDELLWDVPWDRVAHVAAIVQREMESCGAALGVSVPLPVRVRVGRCWGRMEPLDHGQLPPTGPLPPTNPLPPTEQLLPQGDDADDLQSFPAHEENNNSLTREQE